MSKIVSDTISLNLATPFDNFEIENLLSQNYGEIIRWAIIDVVKNGIKVSVTYIKMN